ncbi:16S rRNA (uracil(1498)-N(3))-methyltransferase [Carnimonas bestiolae]|uniref:16S rRNA (uracil(1498)-N(3))-methyltransferase n=1 Tax=Carnimonas bestiolae TaxID=3402172 RepID=UPI003EDBC466
MRIYLDLALESLVGQEITLPDAQARHVGRVMRAREGQSLRLFDGRGCEVDALVASVERRQVDVRVVAKREPLPESPLRVHLGQVVSKGERMDFVVQKATELGVAEITPLYSERADVRLNDEREAKKLAHWRGVAVSACEQCGRAWLPRINSPRRLSDWLEGQHGPLRWILHPGEAGGAVEGDPFDGNVSRETSLLIGPEGGFSDAEVALARSLHFVPRTFGPRILRTETAPLVALSILQSRYGDL